MIALNRTDFDPRREKIEKRNDQSARRVAFDPERLEMIGTPFALAGQIDPPPTSSPSRIFRVLEERNVHASQRRKRRRTWKSIRNSRPTAGSPDGGINRVDP